MVFKTPVSLTIVHLDNLTSETIKGAALAFQCVDDIHSSDSLSASVLSVCNCITDHVLEEDLLGDTRNRNDTRSLAKEGNSIYHIETNEKKRRNMTPFALVLP